MSGVIDIRDLLSDDRVLLDVRSPGEYRSGHIPYALNLPMFSDEERAQVGSVFRKKGQHLAFLRGLELFGPKMRQFVETAISYASEKQVAIYCWRGGMRSAAVKWLLTTAGFQVTTLTGGYKSFRHWVLQQFSKPRQLVLLGGSTGCAKTWVLYALGKLGEQMLDLESLAGHRGSSFGALGRSAQPTQEHFENKLAYLLRSFDDNRPIWLEDESRMIGTCKIPDDLFAQMMASPLFIMHRSRQERLNHICVEYGYHPRDELIKATTRITKRLGHQRTQEALRCIRSGDIKSASQLVLDYYDKAYERSLSRRSDRRVITLPKRDCSISEWAEILVKEQSQLEIPA